MKYQVSRETPETLSNWFIIHTELPKQTQIHLWPWLFRCLSWVVMEVQNGSCPRLVTWHFGYAPHPQKRISNQIYSMIIHYTSGCIQSKTLICGCPNIPKMSIKPSHRYILIPNWWILRKASSQQNMFSQTKIQKPQILTRLLDVGCSAQLTSLVWQRDTTSFGSFKRRRSSTRQRCPSDKCPKQLCQKVWMSRTWNGGDCKITFMWFWFLIIVTCSVCSIK